MNLVARSTRAIERLLLESNTARWRLLLAEVGRGASIATTARIRGDWNKVRLGESVAVGDFVHIWASGGVQIGDESLIAAHTVISSQSHALSAFALGKNYSETRDDAPVSIGRNVWVASNVTICPGVSIGDNAVVGAGAVVLSDVPAGTLVVGAPARVVRTL